MGTRRASSSASADALRGLQPHGGGELDWRIVKLEPARLAGTWATSTVA